MNRFRFEHHFHCHGILNTFCGGMEKYCLQYTDLRNPVNAMTMRKIKHPDQEETTVELTGKYVPMYPEHLVLRTSISKSIWFLDNLGRTRFMRRFHVLYVTMSCPFLLILITSKACRSFPFFASILHLIST